MSKLLIACNLTFGFISFHFFVLFRSGFACFFFFKKKPISFTACCKHYNSTPLTHTQINEKAIVTSPTFQTINYIKSTHRNIVLAAIRNDKRYLFPLIIFFFWKIFLGFLDGLRNLPFSKTVAGSLVAVVAGKVLVLLAILPVLLKSSGSLPKHVYRWFMWTVDKLTRVFYAGWRPSRTNLIFRETVNFFDERNLS